MKNPEHRIQHDPKRPPRFSHMGFAAGLLLLSLNAEPAQARDPVPFNARAGLDIAEAAARSWSPDAFLVYLENDDELDMKGEASRWGYLFYSPSSERARIYSVRDGKILVAEFLELKLEAPPVSAHWIDSGAALEAAERSAGRAFRAKHQGRLRTMLLMRGAFQDDVPDQTTWTLIYSSPGAPSLFVVVDASAGKVRKTWRG